MGEKLICSEPPGINCQEDFDHDWKIVLEKLSVDDRYNLIALLFLAKERKYRIKDIELWPDFMER